MREMSVREANQNFSQVISAVEHGEVIIITKNGTPVARIAPQPSGGNADPEWKRAYRDLVKSLKNKTARGYRVGRITEDDKYGRN